MAETDNVRLTINEREVEAPRGALLIDVATRLGIEIPVFCSHPKLDPVACCRQCLVEFDGPRGTMLNTACNAPVADGMVVRTNTPAVKAAQEANLGFILLHHPLDCPICDKGGECPLQDMTLRFGPGVSQLAEPKRQAAKNYAISDAIILDQERCVVCWRCVRYLEEWEEKPQLGLFERGGDTVIDVQPGSCVDAKTSGNIIDICPVGALTNRTSRFQYRPWQVQRTAAVSLHDAMGNNLSVDTRNGTEVRRILGRENMAVNDQFITDKDRFCHHWARHPDRLTRPLIRRSRQEELTAVSWDEALAFVAQRFATAQQARGSAAVGAVGSAKLSNESNYLLQKWARLCLQTNNVDFRQGGDVKAGFTGVPALAHLMQPQSGPKPHADAAVLFGVDPSEEMPMLDVHLKRAVSRGGMRLLALHPVRTETAARAEVHLPYWPGAELALVQALIRRVLRRRDPMPEVWRAWARTPEADCGAEAAGLDQVAAALEDSARAVILCGPDVSHHPDGRAVREALESLAALTGHAQGLAFIGLEANSQGCRDVGLLPHALPGGDPVDAPEARKRLAALWGGALPPDAGLTYAEMLEGAGRAVQALYVMGADPASESARWAAHLDDVEFLAVQELFLTETARKADAVLPAVSWVETDGTFTNVERRVQRSAQAITCPGSEAAPDWLILDHLASRMGQDWAYRGAPDITRELGQAAPAYAAITWERLGDMGLQRIADAPPAFTPGTPAAAAPSPPPAPGALRLLRGRLFYDAGRLCALTSELAARVPAAFVSVHPADLAAQALQDGDVVAVASAHGSVTVPARADDRLLPGSAWMPESLPGAAVGTLLNGHCWEWVTLSPA